MRIVADAAVTLHCELTSHRNKPRLYTTHTDMHNYTASYTVITNNGLNTMVNHLIWSMRLQAGVFQQHMWSEYYRLAAFEPTLPILGCVVQGSLATDWSVISKDVDWLTQK